VSERPDAPERITLGRIGAPHGVKGWVRLHSLTQPRENILQYRRFVLPSGTVLEMDQAQPHGKSLIAHVVGYDSPEAARELTGLELSVGQDTLPALEDGEYYWHQLIGMRVSTSQEVVLGEVSELIETGANDVLVVRPTEDSIDDRERLLPYLPDRVVTHVDLQAGAMQVDWDPDW
jgi:16S rRNA processing protein RimM